MINNYSETASFRNSKRLALRLFHHAWVEVFKSLQIDIEVTFPKSQLTLCVNYPVISWRSRLQLKVLVIDESKVWSRLNWVQVILREYSLFINDSIRIYTFIDSRLHRGNIDLIGVKDRIWRGNRSRSCALIRVESDSCAPHFDGPVATCLWKLIQSNDTRSSH